MRVLINVLLGSHLNYLFLELVFFPEIQMGSFFFFVILLLFLSIIYTCDQQYLILTMGKHGEYFSGKWKKGKPHIPIIIV